MDRSGFSVDPVMAGPEGGGSEPFLEEEIKLQVPNPGVLVALAGDLSCRGQGEWLDRSYQDRYLDHPEWRLLKRRLALRLRRVTGAGAWLEIKGGGQEENGIWQRPEWRQEAGAGMPACVADLPDGPVRRGLLGFLTDEDPLRELFTCEMRRRVLSVLLEEGARVKVSLDQGVVRAGAVEIGMVEVELEWRAGSREAMRALAADLMARYGLLPAKGSRFHAGLALLAPDPALMARF
ncbi:MAG: CYTH domain-containing protein [Magnetococcales bacterium]|nr:CYTH domain-containing protein [Magnetococcales bacterium]